MSERVAILAIGQLLRRSMEEVAPCTGMAKSYAYEYAQKHRLEIDELVDKAEPLVMTHREVVKIAVEKAQESFEAELGTAFQTLRDIMTSGTDEKNRLQAALSWIDRSIGKVASNVNINAKTTALVVHAQPAEVLEMMDHQLLGSLPLLKRAGEMRRVADGSDQPS